MKVALVFPPSCDPTAPYLSVPTLAAWLRRHGVDVLSVDANLEAWESLLAPEPMAALARRVEERAARLDERPSLSHDEQLLYASLWAARGDAEAVPGAITRAVATLRDPVRFHDADHYHRAVSVVEAAQRVVGAAHGPLSVDFTTCRTPFSLLSVDQVAVEAAPERNPFHASFSRLADRLRDQGVGLVGVSVVFPGQLQPAFSLAHALRAGLPGAHLVVGGPAITQVLARLPAERRLRALGPFHAAILLDGEVALLDLVRRAEAGQWPQGDGCVIRGTPVPDMGDLPCPDFDGLPLDRYLAPELVLPYDPSRGCYWGRCAFCHYGLAEHGTAPYRERPLQAILDHLETLHRRHHARLVYLSHDVLSPRLGSGLARGVVERSIPVRWGTDMRPERAWTGERCQELARGGALCASLGVETASPRVLALLDKGTRTGDARAVFRALSGAGIAAEAMCFTDFPTESAEEARETLRFLRDLGEDLSLFIVGRFHLSHGSRVAGAPADFGVAEVWGVDGDELRTGLFFREAREAKTARERDVVDMEVGRLARGFRLRPYPWAGALSTAHTMASYAHHGKGAFRAVGPAPPPVVPGARARRHPARFDVGEVSRVSSRNESVLWDRMTRVERRVGAARWQELARLLPRAAPSPGTWRVEAAADPERVGPVPPRRRGRRP